MMIGVAAEIAALMVVSGECRSEESLATVAVITGTMAAMSMNFLAGWMWKQGKH